MSEKRPDGATVELCWHASCEVNGKKRDGCGCECHEVKNLRDALDKAKAALRLIHDNSLGFDLARDIAARCLAELEGKK